MTLTKADIIQDICENCDLPKSQSAEVAETIFEIIKSSLEAGESVLVSGFGKFEVKAKNPRKGRNPQTGTAMVLDGRRVVMFRCSKVLKEKINRKN
jgi:integration host factor subunit alpha